MRFRASLVAQMVKNPPAMQETQVQSLLWEDPLEDEMATHSSILAWRIPWTEEPGGLQSIGLQRVGHDWTTKHQHIQVSIHNSPTQYINVCNIFIILTENVNSSICVNNYYSCNHQYIKKCLIWKSISPLKNKISDCTFYGWKTGGSISSCECSVMTDSLQPHRLEHSRLLCPWDFPGKNTGVSCHFLLQGS